jgi:heme/copper-type cytochrome/quinol oxidase subunit 3
MTSSTHGGFFYLIVGLHAAHAIAAIIALVFMYVSLLRGTLRAPTFWAAQIFWYFVVAVWPILYYLVYL